MTVDSWNINETSCRNGAKAWVNGAVAEFGRVGSGGSKSFGSLRSELAGSLARGPGASGFIYADEPHK